MADQITPFSITAPGFYGLNTEASPVDLDKGFALSAINCVIDKAGRVASRKGWTKAHSANSDLGTANITCIGEVIENSGTATVLATGGGFLFKLVGTTLTTLTYGGGGVAPTISDNNWMFCQLNGIGIFWQRNYDPLIYDPAVSTTTFRRLSEKSGSAGTVYQCNVAISAYGRIWAADTATDKSTIVWSDLLTPHIWNTGTAGSLDLRKVWPLGGDEVVGMAAHNGYLYIFGKRQILVYQGAEDPTTMKLADTIIGIGCIARDTIQNIGEDVWFLSDSGLRSLQRTIQEKSAPFRQVSKNVNTDLQAMLDGMSPDDVKSGYSAVNNIYVMYLPDYFMAYCFDTRGTLQDGSSRVTTWQNINPQCFCECSGRRFLIGKAGYVGEYSGYLDDATQYRMTYYTTWIDFGNPIQTSILKKILLTVLGGTNQAVVMKWAYDFSSNYYSQSGTITIATSEAEYGVGEYGINEYVSTGQINILTAYGSSYGRVLQFGFESQINTKPLVIQKIDLFTKDGSLLA